MFFPVSLGSFAPTRCPSWGGARALTKEKVFTEPCRANRRNGATEVECDWRTSGHKYALVLDHSIKMDTQCPISCCPPYEKIYIIVMDNPCKIYRPYTIGERGRMYFFSFSLDKLYHECFERIFQYQT